MAREGFLVPVVASSFMNNGRSSLINKASCCG
jgi:hypothetical protein